MCCMFACCVNPTLATGGAEEAESAYEEAVNAVFNLQLECHRHTQPYKSHKSSKVKWAMIEMWPMQVALSHYPLCQDFDV